jgi:UDP-GlcNAc:undecaprenyl-phosphate GlcNAc-1-phosphate transferase
MEYLTLTLVYLFLFLIVFYLSKNFKWIDIPGKRKIHKYPIYNTGGLIIYFFYLIVVSQYELNSNIELIITVGFFIVIGGFIDDRKNIKPLTKIIIVLIPSIYLIFNGFLISDLGKYEVIDRIYLGKFEIPFIILAIGLLVNATNYIDGVDGLLLSFFSTCLIYYIFLIDDQELKKLLLILLLPILFNLILNLTTQKSGLKFFTGDTGSLFIGFFLCFITIELYNNFRIHPTFLIWPLWYPIYDFLYVTSNRIKKREPFLKPDKSHFHQIIFYKLKKNHFLTSLFFSILNLTVLSCGYLLSTQSKITSLTVFIVGFFLYSLFRLKIKN